MTLADILLQSAQQFPERVAFVFEDENGGRLQWTYAELDRRSRTLAVHIARHASPGDRVMLVYPPGLEFIAAFMGCVYAGMVPVPSTQPKPRRPSPRLDSIVADCSPALVLTQSAVWTSLDFEQLSPSLSTVPWLSTDDIPNESNDAWTPRELSADDAAFLQYTSGSTAEPRGVVISHRNVLHNLGLICEAFSLEREPERAPVGVFWLPAYHDMGLIGSILMPLYVAGTTYLIAPTTFLRKPIRWLELISETQASISGAPNFGYERAVRRTTVEERNRLDLRHWKVAFCGAEPVNADTLVEFAEAFASSGFEKSSYLPCYGLAEVTLFATGGRRPEGPLILDVDRQQLGRHRVVLSEDRDSNSQRLVGCGPSYRGLAVEIVDPQTRHPCGEGMVGEIWVRGESVSSGYWNRDRENPPIFRATLAADEQNGSPSSHYLRTGDLGFLWQGELFVTGRLKDVIIIRGRNHYPQDIERTAQQAHHAIELGAAFATGDRDEQLVLVLQPRREYRKIEGTDVFRSIRDAVVNEHEVDPQTIVLIQPASLPITSSGKVQRSRCRELYEAGELAVLASRTNEANECPELSEEFELEPTFLNAGGDISPAELKAQIEPWLIRWISHRAGLPAGAMAPSTSFAELGIDSLTALEISQELDEALHMRLPPMVIWTCPTPADLAGFLAEQVASQSPMMPGESRA